MGSRIGIGVGWLADQWICSDGYQRWHFGHQTQGSAGVSGLSGNPDVQWNQRSGTPCIASRTQVPHDADARRFEQAQFRWRLHPGDVGMWLWVRGWGSHRSGVGKVHWLPSMVVGCNSTCIGYEDKKFVDFRPDSKLLVLNGMRETVKGRGIAKVAGADVWGSFYYLFENGHFRLLHSVAAEIERFDDTE